MSARLPLVLQQVAEIAGLPAALQLARSAGGTRIYVPKKPTPRFVSQIGDQAANALSELYGGENVDIPLGPVGTLANARRVAEQAIAEGASTTEAAKRSGLTQRSIFARRAKRKTELCSKQLPLFVD